MARLLPRCFETFRPIHLCFRLGSLHETDELTDKQTQPLTRPMTAAL